MLRIFQVFATTRFVAVWILQVLPIASRAAPSTAPSVLSKKSVLDVAVSFKTRI